MQQLRRLWHEGLVDLGVGTLRHDGEEVPALREATLRGGSRRRPFFGLAKSQWVRLFWSDFQAARRTAPLR